MGNSGRLDQVSSPLAINFDRHHRHRCRRRLRDLVVGLAIAQPLRDPDKHQINSNSATAMATTAMKISG
jgi:hypothetical protein